MSQIVERNTKVIESLFKIVIFCGKQGIAFRGHRDDKVDLTSIESTNDGNFLQLVRFRAENDEILSDYLKRAPRNAKYTSKTIQNELVAIVGDQIQRSIVSEVKVARYYSVIADEVTDTSNHEELSLVLRYLYNGEIKEVFVEFIQVERITGKVLGESILNWLTAHNISPTDMRGQCYDGASNMSGAKSGAMAIVQKAAPMAAYHHCASRRLNLSIVSACKNPALKNAELCIGEIARFFSFSAKRQRLLDRAIEASGTESGVKKLKDACRTRWIERIDSYTVFFGATASSISLSKCYDPSTPPSGTRQRLELGW